MVLTEIGRLHLRQGVCSVRALVDHPSLALKIAVTRDAKPLLRPERARRFVALRRPNFPYLGSEPNKDSRPKSLKIMARPKGFEPLTPRFVVLLPKFAVSHYRFRGPFG